VVFDVDDAGRAFDLLVARGATPVTGVKRCTVEGGVVTWFDIATAFGDTLFRFVERAGRTPILPGLERLPAPRGGENGFGIRGVDHLTINFLTLKPALAWMEEVMGFERLWDIQFHTQDVAGCGDGGSGLKSVVMWDPRSGLKIASNEPAQPCFESSQVYLFYRDHRGPGVQHVALAVRDLVEAVRGLRGRGVPFMPTPPVYYEQLPGRLVAQGVSAIEEDVGELRDLEILVDGQAEHRYLLQIFMKEAASLFGDPEAGPMFLELLQRKGDEGFGGGNFRALFESIERQQRIDGRV
jgi:4-hydroxyphenylpyruvate dioxygenase